MKKFDRPSSMLPLAALFAAVVSTACATGPDLGAPAASMDRSAAMPAAAVGETRDWAAIDTNKDQLISPDEMSAYLDASRKATKP